MNVHVRTSSVRVGPALPYSGVLYLALVASTRRTDVQRASDRGLKVSPELPGPVLEKEVTLRLVAVPACRTALRGVARIDRPGSQMYRFDVIRSLTLRDVQYPIRDSRCMDRHNMYDLYGTFEF